MASINSVVLTGNLTRDPETKAAGQTTLTKMRLAVNERFKQNEEWQERPNYFDVVVWGKQGENCAEYLSKGSPVAIDGRLRWHEWEGEGGKRQAVEVVANTVQFLSGGNGGSSRKRDEQPAPDYEATPDAEPKYHGDPAIPEKEDDIPF